MKRVVTRLIESPGEGGSIIRSLGHLLVELSTIRKSRIVTSMKHAYTPMIEIDKSDTIVAGVSPAKVKESQPARLPLHLITESLLRAAYRAHLHFRRQADSPARYGANIVSRLRRRCYG